MANCASAAEPLRTLQQVREWARDRLSMSAQENVGSVALLEAETEYTKSQRLGLNTSSESKAHNVAVGTNSTSRKSV